MTAHDPRNVEIARMNVELHMRNHPDLNEAQAIAAVITNLEHVRDGDDSNIDPEGFETQLGILRDMARPMRIRAVPDPADPAE